MGAYDTKTRQRSTGTKDPGDLERHPAHREIYGDEDLPQQFIEEIDRQGVVPLVIDPDGAIISGWRRVRAARRLGLNEVPARVEQYETEWQEREAIVAYNQQRVKTFSQRFREARVLLKAEQERAKERQGARTDLAQNFAEGETGEAREKIAEVVGWSREQQRKARKIYDAAHKEDLRVGREEVKALDAGDQSIHGAYQRLRGYRERREQRETSGTSSGGGSGSEDDDGRSEHDTVEEWIVGEASPVCRYFTAGTSSFEFPLLLRHAGSSTTRPDWAQQVIIDSGANHDSITNQQVLDAATEMDAEYLVAKDYLGEQRRTTKSIGEFLDLYAGHECEAEVMIPLQWDEGGAGPAEHYRQLTALGEYNIEKHSCFAVALGGNRLTEDRLDTLRRVREHVGQEAYLHAFGIGPSEEFIQAVRSQPGLIDSADSTTVTNKVVCRGAFGPFADGTWRDVNIAKGDGVSAVESRLIEAAYYETHRRVAGMGEHGE